ncbi:MAG: PKD domain-containing protein, partial [candidate division WOR-3 bacterium]|nr:PKD domain-containing protein [candidate division WOR-3 bacterium]
MKHLKFVALLALIVGCSQTGPLKVKAIDILPPGGDVDEITAYVDIQGAGIARLDWEHRAYGIDSLAQTEYWYVDSSDIYTSTLSVTDGWYWLSIYDEDSALLAVSDTIFCGTGSQVPPVADFYAEPTSGEARLCVDFYDQSLNNPTAWLWDYGYGQMHGGPQLRHCYEEPGNYDITLIVSNLAGVDTLTKTNYIQVELPEPPKIDFVGSPTEGEAPLQVTFTDWIISGSSPFGWSQWYFGNGDSLCTWSDCRYTYDTPGDFTVTLIRCDRYDQPGTMIKENYIHVDPNPNIPIADFYAEPTGGESPLTIKFYNQSTSQASSSLQCEWDYGDGIRDT